MKKFVRTLGLVTGASLLALSGAARAAEADDVLIEPPAVEVGTPSDVVVDEPELVVDPGVIEPPAVEVGAPTDLVVDEPELVVDPIVLDDGGIMVSEPKVVMVFEVPVEITRAGDDGIIDPTERNLSGGLDNPEIMYAMAGVGPVEMTDGMADHAPEQAADIAAERVAATATPPTVADPE